MSSLYLVVDDELNTRNRVTQLEDHILIRQRTVNQLTQVRFILLVAFVVFLVFETELALIFYFNGLQSDTEARLHTLEQRVFNLTN